MLRVGVIGCGTIGAEICVAIDSGLVQAELVGIHDVMAAATERVAQRLRRATPVLLQEAVIEAADLVVEATSRDVAPGIIRAALGHGRDILVMSVGGLLACLDDALALAQNGNRHIYVPTGAIAAREDLSELAALGPPLISDEIYDGLVYDGARVVSAQKCGDAAFVLDGFSKRYAITGFRLGYLVAPREAMRPLQTLQQNLFISANRFVQHTAA